MNPPPPPPSASGVFCSISDAEKLLFSYNGGGPELEALAYVWLKKVPLHHAWRSYTTEENRTVGFLTEGGYTYFAISHGGGNLESLLFLRSLRDGFMKQAPSRASAGALRAELDALVRSLIHGSNGGGGDKPGGGSLTIARTARAATPVEVSLISPRDRKKGRDVRGTDQVVGDHHLDRGIKIDIAPEHGAAAVAVASRRSTSNSKLRAPQQHAQKQWRRLVKVVIAIDVVICLGLLAAWLVVCRGLQCVSSSSSSSSSS